jgi:hypothetical protein
MPGVLGITFALYKDEQGGAPLWLETQNVQADAPGHYTALLGSATADGVPLSVFSSAEAHWISTQISGQPESARVLLLSVPYALKAADAETLGGLPASAFVQTAPAQAPGSSVITAKPANSKSTVSPANPTITGTGTTDFIPLWTSSTNLGNSTLFQTGGNVGVSTKTPGAKLDTLGTAIAVRGTSSGATGIGVFGAATSTTGVNFGVQGQSASTAVGSGGVSGTETATTGQVYGVSGKTGSTTANAAGVSGFENAATGRVFGVNGGTNSTTQGAAGVNGFEGAKTGYVFGVSGGTASNTNFSAGVSGNESSTTGQVYGVVGVSNSTTAGAAAVDGYEPAATGRVYGVSGDTASTGPFAAGVFGNEAATTGQVFGVIGATNSKTNGAAGVSGSENATTGAVYGVYGSANSTTANAMGVSGYEGAAQGQVYGVNGNTSSTGPFAAAVNGYEGATTGQVYGVSGSTPSTSGIGVNGNATATTGSTNGVYGHVNSPNGNGVFGLNSSSGSSLLGNGVFGLSTASSGASWGVKGASNSANGVGVEGYSFAVGVRGQGLFCGSSGCVPEAADAGQFITAAGGNILHGFLNTAGTWTEMFRVDSSGNGYFAGNLNVKGMLSKGSGSFKIDHPLDPASKYLSHSFVESPDMMNVYNGNIMTDNHGIATVVLPDYFEALNRDFRYQLTVIGQFAQAIVKQEIKNNRFIIKTNKPSVKVSWQVTGIRHDAYADANRIPVEEEKPPREQGHYLHPELFGASEQQAIGAGLPTPSTGSADPTRASLVTPLSEAGKPVK